MYDYLIVGSGLFGSICAHELHKKGHTVLVIEKRNHIGGNVYTEDNKGIQVHKYGAHIFHTDNKKIWDYVNQFVEFNRFTNSPLANYQGKFYNLPFNMNTFYQLWGCRTPEEARKIIKQQIKESGITTPTNLEEQAISIIGRDIYDILIKGYTEKQWGRSATELPPFIIKRLPVRYTFDNNYFNDKYQGIPIGGYTQLITALLSGIEVKLNTDFLENRNYYRSLCNKVIYTGQIDAYFDYTFGSLEYRSLRFETTTLPMENFQGNAVINYTEKEVPYTRIIEHKHFELVDTDHTVVTKEYACDWKKGDEAYYPINDTLNNEIYSKYQQLAQQEDGVLFGGRLAEYKYYDMHKIIENALNLIKKEIQ